MIAKQSNILSWVEEHVKNIETRDYQIEAWNRLQQHRADGRKRALIHLATGLGKTSVAAVDAFHYLSVEKQRSRVLFVSHMNDISRQAKATFLFVNPGFTTHTFRGYVEDVDVTFATFQGLYKQLGTIDPQYYSYIIWDEAHHIEAETFSAVRKHFDPEFELALTATPERADGRDIFNYFGNPLYTKSLADGINDGWLSAIDYHIVFDEAIKLAMTEKFEIKTLKEIRELFAIRSRNEVIGQEVLARRKEIGLDKAKTIVFCRNISAASEMAELLHGEVYHSDVPADQRQAIMRRFKSGSLQVICTVDMFNEGIDIPDARLVVFLRSTSSRTIFEQQLGRGLRRAPGKDQVTVLDFVANVERINFVRELGRHVQPSRYTHRSSVGGENGKSEQAFSETFLVNNFEFEDQVIDLMSRYDALHRIEYLTTAEVIAAFNKTHSIQQTADHFRVSWQAIKKHLSKSGVPTSDHLQAARHLVIEDVVEKYHELGSLNQVAAYFGVGSYVIKNRLMSAGIKINQPNRIKFASPELIEAFERTGSIRQAAIELGVGRHSARKNLLNSGIYTIRKENRNDNQTRSNK